MIWCLDFEGKEGEKVRRGAGEKMKVEHKWIPWRRYVLFMRIDGSQKKMMGRLPRKDSALKVAERRALYAGYIPEIYDTKAQATLSLNRNPFHREP